MRPTSSLVQLAVCLSSLTPLTAAWSGWFPDIDSLVVRHVVRQDISLPRETGILKARQDSKSDEEQTTNTREVSTANLNTAKESATGDAETATETGTETGKTTKSDSKTTGKKNTKESEPTHTTFNPVDAPGGVSMISPATALQPTPLFMIGDIATFAWNYTSLQGKPSYIDVLVSCSKAAATYTISANMTFQNKPTVVWDTKEQAEDVNLPLPVALYTLIIKDSESEITDGPEPGYLAVQDDFQFGLYTGQPYTPYPQWDCPTCSAATAVNHQAVGFALTMSIITVATFTWFVTGLGLQ
ncbi:hypothetical protein FZEAL_8275 [Fusarium zealandicum]|uniref:DUF7137 domain-containing protein n=1 Tax=Fusarium zealandicum TaxID=1053134 RepID=A0A8H4UE47_9HYPO|nr:hypothetical protein FZEAL_8275 [Fusarium zealandicum]